MKLDPPIVTDSGLILEEVNPVDAGVYLIFRVPNVQRRISGKNKKCVDELLIHGIPWKYADRVLAKYGIRIEKVAL